MESEGGAVAILPSFQISEEPTDIGKEEVAYISSPIVSLLCCGWSVTRKTGQGGKAGRHRKGNGQHGSEANGAGRPLIGRRRPARMQRL